MWFKNLKAYFITSPIDWQQDKVDTQLAEFSFRPCGNLDLATMGWVPPIHGEKGLLHGANNCYWIALKKQERILPAAVINAELADKVAKIESETGSPVNKKAQQDLKQEVITQLLPKAFTRDSITHAIVCPKQNMVFVDAGSDGKAEGLLAMLRKAIGSLPIVPFARSSMDAHLTLWVKDKAPEQFEVLEEAELKSDDEDGAIARFKNQPLNEDEVLHHIDAGKRVTKLGVCWDESVNMVVDADLTLKRLKFTDLIKEQNEDIPKDQQSARLDADFALMSGLLIKLADELVTAFDIERP